MSGGDEDAEEDEAKKVRSRKKYFKHFHFHDLQHLQPHSSPPPTCDSMPSQAEAKLAETASTKAPG